MDGTPEGKAEQPAANLLQTGLLAAMAGALGGALAATVILGIEHAQGMVWGAAINQGAPPGPSPVLALGITSSIGLALALIQRHRSPALLPELNETLRSLRGTEPPDNRHQSRRLLSGVLALIGGGSLGPEALVTHLAVLVSQWTWRGRDRTVVAAAMAGSLGLFQSPLVGASALAGSGCGLALLGWRRWLKGLEPLRRFWPAPILTGILLGLALWLLPLATFSGEHQLGPLLLGTWALTPGLAILSGLAKLLLVGLCLETGWRGGQFFPVIVGSYAIGLGLHELLPQFGSLESWCGSVVGGSLGVLLPSPLLALVLGITLLQGHGSVAVLLGLLVGQGGLHLLRGGAASGRQP